jgi:hypothetical protein
MLGRQSGQTEQADGRPGCLTRRDRLAGVLLEFPKGVDYQRQLAACLDGCPEALACRHWLLPLRQVLFAATVLVHVLRRGLPPW